MKRIIAFVVLLLAASASWATGACTIYVDSDGGSDTSPYDTCAKGSNDLGAAITAWNVGDVICIDANATTPHNESTAATLTYTNANDSWTNPVEVITVDCAASDAYTIPSAAQITVTGAGNDISVQLHHKFKGLRFDVADEYRVESVSGYAALEDVYIKVVTNIEMDADVQVNNLTVEAGGTNARIETQPSWNASPWYGLTFVGADWSAAGALTPQYGRGIMRFHGCDLSAMQNQVLVDTSLGATNGRTAFEFFECTMPANYSLTDGAWDSPLDYVLLRASAATGAGTAKRYEYRKEMQVGSVTDDTTTYREDGWVSSEGDTRVAHRLNPNANTDIANPLIGDDLFAYVATTGSTTFSLYVCHDYSTAPTKEELYFRLMALETSNSLEWSYNTTEDHTGSTALDSTSKTWTDGTLIDAQDETSYDNSPTTEGTFAGGTGHAVSDVITLADGSTATVDAVSAGVVTQFTIDSSAGSAIDVGDEIAQSSTTGSGTGFAVTPDTDNATAACTPAQIDLTITVNKAGPYQLTPYLALEETDGLVWYDLKVDAL